MDDGAALSSEAEIDPPRHRAIGDDSGREDLRRSVDLLQTIDLVDPERIVFRAVHGAILGATFSGVDDRLACSALIVAARTGRDRRESAHGRRACLGAVDPRAIGAFLRESDR